MNELRLVQLYAFGTALSEVLTLEQLVFGHLKLACAIAPKKLELRGQSKETAL